MKRLKKDISDIANIPRKKMEDLTPEQQDQYDNATTCWICNGEFTEDDEEKNYKVRDHNHYTGEFRGVHTIYVILDIENLTLYLFSFTTLEVMMDT